MNALDSKYWNSRYLNHTFGWDIGYPSPAIVEYITNLKPKHGLKIAIPGAGLSHEAEFIHRNYPQHAVYVFDVSSVALNSFLNRVPDFPKHRILEADFLNLPGNYHLFFDLIIEQTFFCALLPIQRQMYFKSMNRYLKNGAVLAGLWFNDFFNASEPPFGATEAEYKKLSSECFLIKSFKVCQNSVPSRQNREWFFELVKPDES